MIVLDASIVVELLLNGPLADSLRRELAKQHDGFMVPHLLDVEVVSALRSLAVGLRIDSHRSEQLIQQLTDLPVERYPHTPLLGRIWELRHNFTSYDAAYIALAEAMNATLYTSDVKLCKPIGQRLCCFRREGSLSEGRLTARDSVVA